MKAVLRMREKPSEEEDPGDASQTQEVYTKELLLQFWWVCVLVPQRHVAHASRLLLHRVTAGILQSLVSIGL